MHLRLCDREHVCAAILGSSSSAFSDSHIILPFRDPICHDRPEQKKFPYPSSGLSWLKKPLLSKMNSELGDGFTSQPDRYCRILFAESAPFKLPTAEQGLARFPQKLTFVLDAFAGVQLRT
jgi:hypothetical protein